MVDVATLEILSEALRANLRRREPRPAYDAWVRSLPENIEFCGMTFRQDSLRPCLYSRPLQLP